MEMKFIARNKSARLFHLRISEYDGDVEIISGNELARPEPYSGVRLDTAVWTLRDLRVALRLWLGHYSLETTREVWRAAKPADPAETAANIPCVGGTDVPFGEWQTAIIASQREAFQRDCSPDAWGDRVKAGDAIVVLSTHRDADHITESNFDTAVKWMEGLGESARGAQWDTVGYGHWAVGHVDYLFVAADSDAARIAQVICEKLENYPMLDEDDVSERGSDTAWEWILHDMEDLIAYSRDGRLKVEAANALYEGVEFDIYGDGNDSMSYRVSVREMAERFGLEMDEDDVEHVRRMSYGTYADEPIPLDEWHTAEYASFESMVRGQRRLARDQKWYKDRVNSQTKKGVRLVLTGNTGFIVRNGLVYEVSGRYAAQDTWERLIALNAQKEGQRE